MHKANLVTPPYRGVSKDDSQSVVVVHQAEEAVAKAMFEGAIEPIEAAGHNGIQPLLEVTWHVEK